MMENINVRIENIEIENIKNVEKGSICLNEVDNETFGSSIIGIYGQNGSGKTALIWAMELIKEAFSGNSLPEDSYYYICNKCDSAMVNATFIINVDNREYQVMYTLEIGKASEKDFYIKKELLEYKAKQTEQYQRIVKTKILGVNSVAEDIEIDKCLYYPESRLDEMSTKDKQIRQKLLVVQALAKEKKCSYIFDEKVTTLLKEAFVDKIYYKIISILQFYGRMNMFVLNRNSESSFNMDLLPLSLRLRSTDGITKSDQVLVGLGRNASNILVYNTINLVFEQINTLICAIIPELKVEVKEISRQLNEKAEEQVIFELVSNREGIITPLRYESEGIKKILYMLSSLIAMYNNKSIFVAIDEMDAGIFEYLLGELLSVINQTGRGQLLFTSHNMRPLEVLDNTNIYFTTTNPQNKYIKFTGIKDNNNLRMTLLRTIDLGGQKESIYESTSSYQIGKAFRKAGSVNNG